MTHRRRQNIFQSAKRPAYRRETVYSQIAVKTYQRISDR